ncbi:MAG: hypothetical protein CM15mP98_06650 [Paracoccaceae bacterium]|nr:MAG: hypothetical protein CM15mP98_06650 [Paracoccaceae bacterium]
MKQTEDESQIKESLNNSFSKDANDPISSEIESDMHDSIRTK